MPARPLGRSLADFESLLHAEQNLLESCRRGDECFISGHRPGVNRKTAANTVRAEFLRFLILGGDEGNPVHERGVRVQGAWIEGKLELEGTECTCDICTISCWFDQAPVLANAHIGGSLLLSGSRVPGIVGDGLNCDANLYCRDKFLSDGEVRLLGAAIGGDLSFSDATLNGPLTELKPSGNALTADGINVKGKVSLDKKFTANGEVRLLSATIGGDLVCVDAVFNGPLKEDKRAGNALHADRIKVKGCVFLQNIIANGEVRLLGAEISVDLSCERSIFNTETEFSILAEGMSISGAFFFRDLKAPAKHVNLSDARVRVLVDDKDTWSDNLYLDGFIYERFSGASPTEAETRLKWLDKQTQESSGKGGKTDEFKAQPWLQLRKVLLEAGHLEDARKVGIAFENRRRRAGQITGDDPITRFFAKNFHRIYGVFTGYGYRPIRLLYWSLFIWLACAALYDYDAYRNKFTPAAFSIYEDPSCRAVTVAEKGAPPGNPVFEPPCNGNYTTFSPLMYSLNVFLPVVQLGQESAWAPATKPFSPIWWQNFSRPFTEPASFLQLVIWLETLLGWIAGLLLVAVVSGLARKQDDS